jgi:hypothetical protein
MNHEFQELENINDIKFKKKIVDNIRIIESDLSRLNKNILILYQKMDHFIKLYYDFEKFINNTKAHTISNLINKNNKNDRFLQLDDFFDFNYNSEKIGFIFMENVYLTAILNDIFLRIPNQLSKNLLFENDIKRLSQSKYLHNIMSMTIIDENMKDCLLGIHSFFITIKD